MIKNPPFNAGDIRDAGLIPGSGRSPGKGNGNPRQYSCLENPMHRRAWHATVHRVAESWARRKQSSRDSTSCVKERNGDRDRQQRSVWILLRSHSVCTASASQPEDHASHVCVSASREQLRASSPESDMFHSVIHSFWKVRGRSMVIKQI